mgnify:CR=1 FL=1
METLPKHVINKIFLFLEHPTAKITKRETIFKFMALRLGDGESKRGGSPHLCGVSDSWNTEEFNERLDGRNYHSVESVPANWNPLASGRFHPQEMLERLRW